MLRSHQLGTPDGTAIRDPSRSPSRPGRRLIMTRRADAADKLFIQQEAPLSSPPTSCIPFKMKPPKIWNSSTLTWYPLAFPREQRRTILNPVQTSLGNKFPALFHQC